MTFASPDETPTLTNHLDYLMVLRCFACLLVAIIHYASMVPEGVFSGPGSRSFVTLFGLPAKWLIVGDGAVGVWIFFLLSGYLIGKGFASKRYAFTPSGIGHFLYNRLLRIVPLYYVYFACAIVYGDTKVNAAILWKIATFRYSIPFTGHLWSIVTEMQFYLIAPVIALVLFKLITTRKQIFIALGAFLAFNIAYHSYLYNIYIKDFNWGFFLNDIYTPLGPNLLFFVSGMMINYFTGNRQPLSRRTLARIMPLAFVGLYVFSCFLNDGSWMIYDHDVPLWHFILKSRPFLCVLLIGLIIFYVDKGVNTKQMPLSLTAIKQNPWRIIEIGGTLTYGMYVWQDMVIHMYRPYISPHTPLEYFTGFGILFISLLLVSAASYLLIERPFNRLKYHR